MTLRKIGIALFTASLLMFGFLTPSQAADPVTIPPGTFVVDDADVLSSSEQDDLEQQIQQLQSEHGASLFVVYVPSFENPAEPEAWVEQVAEQKQLGTNDSILAIATEDRLYNFVSHSSGPFREYQSSIDRDHILPALSNSDWYGAGEGAIDGLATAAGGGSTGGGGLLWILLPVGIGVAVFAWNRNSKKNNRKQQPTPSEPSDPRDAMPVADLRTEAGSALIQADDAIKVAEQEIGFAQAAYGDDSVELFQQDLHEAKVHMQESFQLQYQLDDHRPDTEQEQRAWLKEILDRSAQVVTSLQEHEADFAKLRDLEKNAPAALEEVKAVFAPFDAQLQEVSVTLEQLANDYDAKALEDGRDNFAQAEGLVAFGHEKITEADNALHSADTSSAAWSIHEAENTSQELRELLESLKLLPSQLDTAQRQLSVELAQAQSLVTEATDFAAQHRTDSVLPQRIAGLEHVVENISAHLPSRNPLRDLDSLDDTLDPLEDALEPLRDQQQRVDAARRDYQPMLAKARTAIDSADDYIRHRRGAVRHDARTKLSAAQTHFNTALDLGERDPVQAVAEAHKAAQLGRLAQQLAEQNYHDFDQYHRGHRRGGSNMNAMLGGLLLGQIFGGGRSSGGSTMFGGGSTGGGGGFFGGSGGGFSGGGGGFGGGSGGSF